MRRTLMTPAQKAARNARERRRYARNRNTICAQVQKRYAMNADVINKRRRAAWRRKAHPAIKRGRKHILFAGCVAASKVRLIFNGHAWTLRP